MQTNIHTLTMVCCFSFIFFEMGEKIHGRQLTRGSFCICKRFDQQNQLECILKMPCKENCKSGLEIRLNSPKDMFSSQMAKLQTQNDHLHLSSFKAFICAKDSCADGSNVCYPCLYPCSIKKLKTFQCRLQSEKPSTFHFDGENLFKSEFRAPPIECNVNFICCICLHLAG